MQKSPTTVTGGDPAPRRRRPGEPRRLLIEASRDVFGRKGYGGATTREIADLADVSETLIFRYFAGKAGLFRESVVQPFVEALDRVVEHGKTLQPTTETSREGIRAFVGTMYDVFHDHRALAAMVFAADALVESELAEAGVIDDVRAAIDRLVHYESDAAKARGSMVPPAAQELATRGHLVMVAGAATFGSWYFGKRRPSRSMVVNELSEWIWVLRCWSLDESVTRRTTG